MFKVQKFILLISFAENCYVNSLNKKLSWSRDDADDDLKFSRTAFISYTVFSELTQHLLNPCYFLLNIQKQIFLSQITHHTLITQ